MRTIDRTTLQEALEATLAAHDLPPSFVASRRDAWQVFHRAGFEGHLNIPYFYTLYTDATIEAAMKAIFNFPPLGE